MPDGDFLVQVSEDLDSQVEPLEGVCSGNQLGYVIAVRNTSKGGSYR